MSHLSYYPNKYLKAIIHDMNMDDADAYIAIYTMTCKDLYRTVIRIIKDSYHTEQILKEVYIELFSKDHYDTNPKTFINDLKSSATRKASDYLIHNGKGEDTGSSFTNRNMELLLPLILVQAGRKEGDYSFETMCDYAKYRTRLSIFEKVFLAALFVFVIDVILHFIPAKFTLVPGETPTKPVVLVNVESLLDIHAITAEIDGVEMRITQESNGMYLIRTNKNGTLTVTVKQGFGFMNQKKTIDITNVDDKAPTLKESKVENNQLFLMIEDEGTLDTESIYGVLKDGSVVPYISFEEKTNTIIFENNVDLEKIIIPDTAGNTLSLSVAR